MKQLNSKIPTVASNINSKTAKLEGYLALSTSLGKAVGIVKDLQMAEKFLKQPSLAIMPTFPVKNFNSATFYNLSSLSFLAFSV